jgi:chromosome segregation ATPase
VIATYSKQIDSLKREIVEDRKESETQVSELKQSIDSLRKEREEQESAFQSKIEKLESENRVQAQEKTQLQNNVHGDQSELKQLNDEIERLRTRLRETESEAMQRIQSLTKEVAASRTEMEKQQKYWGQQIQSLTKDCETLRTAEDLHRQTSKDLTEENDLLKEQNLRQARKIRKLVRRHCELEAIARANDLTVAVDLVGNLGKANGVILELQKELANRGLESERLTKQIGRLEIGLANMKDANTQLKLAAAEFAAEKEDIRQELAKVNAEAEYNVRKLEMIHKADTDRIHAQKYEIQDLKKRLATASPEGVDVMEQLIESRKMNEKLLSRIREFEQTDSLHQIAELQVINQELENRIAELTQNNETVSTKQKQDPKHTSRLQLSQQLAACLVTIGELLDSASVLQNHSILQALVSLKRKIEAMEQNQSRPA